MRRRSWRKKDRDSRVQRRWRRGAYVPFILILLCVLGHAVDKCAGRLWAASGGGRLDGDCIRRDII